MNALVWLMIGAPSAFVLTEYAYVTLANDLLGIAFMGLFILCLLMGAATAVRDWRIVLGEFDEDDDDAE